MSEPNRPHQIIENEHVRRLRERLRRMGRELPPPEDLVPEDFMKPLFMKEPNQVTTPARTLSPLQPTSRPVPQSLNSRDSDEQIVERTSTEEEEGTEQGRKSKGLQPEIGIAIQQRIKDLEEEKSRSVSPPQQQRITSFKDALEVHLQVKGSKAAEVASSRTTLMQLLYDKVIEAQTATWENTKKTLAAHADMLMESTDDPSLRSMSVQEREGAFKMLQLIESEVAAKPTLTTTTNPRHKPRFYAVLGGPGSGKSTICASWAKLDGGVMHIAIGDILRSEAKRPDSPYAEVLKANLAKGAIGDPEMTVGLIKDHMRTTIKAASGPIHTYLLDGFPRALASAQYFERTVGPLSGVIILDIPEATLIDRCRQRNRSDDNEDAIRERIRVYNTKSAEVVAAYHLQGKVSYVTQPPDSHIRPWTGVLSAMMMDSYLPLDIPETVLRDVVACGILIWRFCDIRYDRRGGDAR